MLCLGYGGLGAWPPVATPHPQRPEPQPQRAAQTQGLPCSLRLPPSQKGSACSHGAACPTPSCLGLMDAQEGHTGLPIHSVGLTVLLGLLQEAGRLAGS